MEQQREIRRERGWCGCALRGENYSEDRESLRQAGIRSLFGDTKENQLNQPKLERFELIQGMSGEKIQINIKQRSAQD